MTTSAAAFAALLLLAALPSPLAHAQALALAPSGFRPASMGLSTPTGGLPAAVLPSPTYDEQIGATFVQSLSSLAFNVTALAQTGIDGYGPAYILNGLSSTGYWYQVGVSYHWPSSSGGYYTGFGFNYQVYSPSGKSVFPTNGGSGIGGFSKAVGSGDNVLLTLVFSGATVTMSATDTVNGAQAKTSYSSVGASTFVGSSSGPANSQGFFSGIMTEWYHVGQYTGSEGKVTYTDNLVALTSAWLWADEFNAGSSGPPVFDNQTKTPVSFTDVNQIYPFESNGATIYGSAHQFITGLLNSATSVLTFKPANNETAFPGLIATYTLAGLSQTAALAEGASTVEADPNTSITVAINSSGNGNLDEWVFSTTSPSHVTLAAGQSVTYVYYELVTETVSAETADGSTFSSPPEVTYTTAASMPSSAAAEQNASAQIGSAPTTFLALIGTTITAENVTSTSTERWATVGQSWTVSGPNSIPPLVRYYHQFEVGIAYFLNGTLATVGSGPSSPAVSSTAFGRLVMIVVDQPVEPFIPGITPLVNPNPVRVFGGEFIGWFDAGSTFSMPAVLNGTSSDRWVGGQYSGEKGSASDSLSSSNLFAWLYTHQFYVTFGLNEASGGTVSPTSGWYDMGDRFNATASAVKGWQFENWIGSGQGAFNGTQSVFAVNVTGSLVETATVYPGLTVTADPHTNVAYAYLGISGSLPAGTTKILYVPPNTVVTLQASPTSFLFSLHPWTGAGNPGQGSTFIVGVVMPVAASASSGYDLAVIGGISLVALIVVVGSVALVVRSRRKKAMGYGPWPS